MTEPRAVIAPNVDERHFCNTKCISWSAILLGALVIVGLSFLMNLLSLAAGFSAFPTTENDKLMYGVGGFVGLAVVTIIVMFIGGWLAGYLGGAGCYRRRLGEVYGFSAWSLGLIIAILIGSGMSQFIANYDFVISRNMPVVRMAAAELAQKTAEPTANAAANTTSEEAKNALAAATFATFSLFALGAIAACFGGHTGMNRCRRDDRKFNRTTV